MRKQSQAEERKARTMLVQGFVREGRRAHDEGDYLGALLPWTDALAAELPDAAASLEAQRLRLALFEEASPRLVQAFFHNGSISDIEFDAAGRWLLTCGTTRATTDSLRWSGSARVWDVETGQPVTPWLTQHSPIVQGAFRRDGKAVVTASGDSSGRQGRGSAQVWELPSGRAVGLLLQHPGAAPRDPPANADYVIRHVGIITQAVFSPDGNLVATASDEGTVRLWDAATGKANGQPLRHPDSVTQVCFHPDGRLLATGCEDGRARLWDVAARQKVGKDMAHKLSVVRLQYSPDGRRLATADLSGTAQIWDGATGNPLAPALDHGGTLRWIEFSPNGERVVTVGATNSTGSEHSARVWDAGSGKPLTPHLMHPGAQNAAFSPDGRWLATAGQGVRCWDSHTGRRTLAPLPHGSQVRFHPDGHRLLASDGSAAWLWELPLAMPLAITASGPVRLAQAVLSPDGSMVAAASVWRGSDQEQSEVSLWDLRHGVRVGKSWSQSGAVRALGFSADGRRLASGSEDGTAQVWDLHQSAAVTAALRHDSPVGSVLVNRDGSRLITVAGKAVHVWDCATGKPVVPPLLHTLPVTAIASSADERQLATGSGIDLHDKGEARVWNLATGQPQTPILGQRGAVKWLRFACNGHRLVTASEHGVGVIHSFAQVWDADAGTAITAAMPRSGQPTVLSDERTLLLGNQLVDLESGSIRPAMPEAVGVLFYSPSAQRLAAVMPGQSNGPTASEIRIWDVSQRKPLGPAIRTAGEVRRVLFDTADRWLATAATLQVDGRFETRVQLWDCSNGEPLGPPWVLPVEIETMRLSDGDGAVPVREIQRYAGLVLARAADQRAARHRRAQPTSANAHRQAPGRGGRARRGESARRLARLDQARLALAPPQRGRDRLAPPRGRTRPGRAELARGVLASRSRDCARAQRPVAAPGTGPGRQGIEAVAASGRGLYRGARGRTGG